MDLVSRLDPLIEGLRSDKIKTRETALKDLLLLLRDGKRVGELNEAGEEDANLFTDLLKAIFRCVDEEKKAVTKKETAVALRRLTDATALLRVAIAQTAGNLNRRHASDLLRHTLNVLEHKGGLYEPAAIDYLRTLKCLFSHPQHLDNLDAGEWEGLVCTLTRAAFDEGLVGHGAEVLDERFTSKEARGVDLIAALGGEDDIKGKLKAKATPRRVESEDDEDDDAPSTSMAGSRKRSRATSSRPYPSTPGPSQRVPSGTQTPSTQLFSGATASRVLGIGQQRSISQTQIAIFSLLLTLLQTPRSLPLLSTSVVPPTLPSAEGASLPAAFPRFNVALAVLYKLLRFLIFFPETTSHLSVLKSLNLVLGVVRLNQLRAIALFADRLLPTLLRLWKTTKSKEIKEQLLISLKSVIPFSARDLPSDFGGRPSRNEEASQVVGEGDVSAAEKLHKIREALDEEVDSRWAVEPLALESLRLELALPSSRDAFVAQSFRFGPKFKASQAASWATLELHADVYAAIDGLSRSDASAHGLTPRSLGKRRRVDDTLDGLLDAIDISVSTSAKVSRLQLLLFVISRHGHQLVDRHGEVIKALVGVLTHDDALVQSWSLLGLAALACVGNVERGAAPHARPFDHPPTPFASPSKNHTASNLDDAWEQAWTFATRRMALPAVSRAASHACLAIAANARVSPIRLQTDLETLLGSLEAQGPSFPYDSVCAFLVLALRAASRNVRLFRLNLEDRVMAWLIGTWSVIDGTTKGFNVRSRLENHTPDDLLGLLASISRFEHRPGIAGEDPLPESPVVDYAINEAQSTILRDFVLDHRLHQSPPSSRATVTDSTPADSIGENPGPAASTMGFRDLTGRPRRASDFLLKSTEALLAEWEGPDGFASVTADKVRRTLDFVALVIAYGGVLELNNVSPNRKMIKRACTLALAVMPALSGGRIPLADMAIAIKGLEVLVTTESEPQQHPASATLLGPGPLTGIRRDLLPSTSAGPDQQITAAKSAIRAQLLQVLWQGSDLRDLFNQAARPLKAILNAAVGLAPEESAMDVEGEETMPAYGVQDSLDYVPMITLEKGDGSDTGLCFPSRSADWLVATCFATITRGAALQSGLTEPSRQKELYDELAGCDCPQFIALGSAVSRAIRAGYLHVSSASADDILEGFHHFLSSYQYRRNELLHAFAVDFLCATANLWIEASTTRTDFGHHARALIEYLVKQWSTGRLRSPALRIQLLQFFEVYLQIDPHEQVWALFNGAIAPSTLQIFHSAARDVDVHVRFAAASILPRLYDFVARLIAQPFRDYNETYVETAVAGYEQSLTNAVLLANYLIRSTILRRMAYYHFLDLEKGGASVAHLRAVIEAAARTLGFGSPFELWQVYATTITVQSLGCAPGSEWKPADSLIGATSQQENARSMLHDLGHLLIGKRQLGRFADLVLASGRSEIDVVAESAPRALGGLLCNALKSSVDDRNFIDDIEGILATAGCASSARDLAAQSPDVVLTQAFSELINPTEILEDLTESDSQLAAQAAFRELGRPLPDIFRWDSLLLPRSTALAIFRVDEWVRQAAELEASDLPSTAFNVLYQLFSRIGRSPLIIEQIRGVYSVIYFVACHQAVFRTSSALLRNLLHLALVLMEQDELAPLVDALLHWGMGLLADPVEGDAGAAVDTSAPLGLAEVLLRIARVGDRLESQSTQPDLSQVGYDLLIKAEATLLGLRAITDATWAVTVDTVVALWPRPFFSCDLIALRDSANLSSLSSILQDSSLTTSKFALVPRLRQLVSNLSADQRDKFAGNWVWQLKQSLPAPGDLQRHASQIEAYLEILQTAQMQAPSLKAINQLPRPRSLEWDRHRPSVEDAAKSQVILALVDRLQIEAVETIDIAYQVLQGVISAAEPLISASAFRAALVKRPDVREQLTLLGRPAARPHGFAALSLSEIHHQVSVASVQRPARWLCRLASFLARVLVAQDTLFGHLVPLLNHSATFAAATLPLLVQALVAGNLIAEGPRSAKTILSTYFATILRAPAADLPIKQAIIDVVLHLRRIESRTSDPKAPGDPLAHEHWLDHEYLLLAKAAVECKAYTTGLLFLELQHQAAGEAAAPDEEATQILFSIYANIEDPDGFYGVKSADWRSSLVQKLHHENRWAQAFGFHGADYRYAPSPASVEGIYRSLHSFGFDRMALTLAQSGDSQHAGVDVKDDLGYDLAWRTETWDIPVSTMTSTAAGPPSSNALLYAALRAVHNERSSTIVLSTVSTAIHVELAKLRGLSIESMAEVRAVQATLVCLREVRRWLDLGVGDGNWSREQWDEALPWVGDGHDFADLETLISVRSSLLQTVASRKTSIISEDNPTIRAVQKDLQLRLSTHARSSGQLQSAINAVTMAQKLDVAGDVAHVGVLHEYANVLWASEEHGMAIDIQRSLLDDPSLISSDDVAKMQRARHLSVLGDWMSTARLDTAARTEAEYFAPAIALLAGLPSAKEHGLVYHRFAIFAESQFRTLEKSPEIQRLRLYNDRQRQELSNLVQANGKPRPNLPRDATGSSRFDKVTRLQQDDANKIRAHEETVQALLRTAIDMYGKALASSDDFDDALLRLASLWMSHHAREDLHASVKATIGAIPSHKFIRIVIQLSARLEDLATNFQAILHGVFERLVAEHPFHCLYQLLTARGFGLSQRKEGDRRRSNGARGSASATKAQDDGLRTSRSFAAERILAKVAKKSSTATSRIRDVDLFCEAAIEWAWLPPEQPKVIPGTRKAPALVMDKGLKIAQIRNLAIPIPTAPLAIDLTCRYRANAIVTIKGFAREWVRAGGIHVPKITTCVGDDGRAYKQLYKSDDDIRQDAVMEQLFGIVNDLLARDPKTRSRHLHMLTYKVVPLSDLTGFIEFVTDTLPIDSFLRRSHQKYFPNDPSLSDLRKKIAEWQNTCPPEKVGRKFAEATSRIHPVMRYFFTEKHKTPLAWFTMRLQYARSAATSSMIGHAVGLGDRHCSNILIHEKTGELIHIDHGVAFDGGRRLRIPELVPFRLTADIVDGLGMSGVEGVFRRCAEETLRVMRDSVETIMTVLEVCKHDPMHNWGIDADKLARVQGNVDVVDNPDVIRDSTDEDADRALTSVRSKLSKTLSVEYTVNDLIQQARDPVNLGSIFTGWQAWM